MKAAAPWVWTRPISLRWADAWLERIAFVGFDRVVLVEKPGAKLGRLEAYPADKKTADLLTRSFGGRLRRTSATNWLKKSAPGAPLRIGKKLIIHPEKPKAAKKEAVPSLVIPAGIAFGTGQHATTGMLLRSLASLSGAWPERRVLDAGTGSGILALAMRRLGAGKVEAFDYDPTAVRVARENEHANFPHPAVAWAERDVLRWKAPQNGYDVICANLYSELLVAAALRLAGALKPGGSLFLSGVLRDQIPDVDRAFAKAGLPPLSWKKRGKWAMASARKAGLPRRGGRR
ncbi:MAG: 50S ribosomal protein L11 methyltransferase [Verrucomicrobium sp.]|nr:50S ribosomal protein L11 methyltransferase [Verrucomicrobium sp.]